MSATAAARLLLLLLALLLLLFPSAPMAGPADPGEEEAARPAPEKSARLFTNPLGVFGHMPCDTEAFGVVATGLCYNELECVANGGQIHGYCSPSALGICCVFSSNNCGKTVTQPISYFTNPSYPLKDTMPISCLLQIRPARDVCYLQLDFEEMEVASINGKCAYDMITLLRSPEGPSGRFCGYRNSFATLAKVNAFEEVGLSAVMQTANYRWKIRMTMIHCDNVVEHPR